MNKKVLFIVIGLLLVGWFTAFILIPAFSVADIVDKSRAAAFTVTVNSVVSSAEVAVLSDEMYGESKEGTFCYSLKYLDELGYLGDLTVTDYGEITDGYAGYVKVVKDNAVDSRDYVYYVTLVDYYNEYSIELYDYTNNGILDYSYEGLNLSIPSNFISGPSSSNDYSYDTDCNENNTYQ